MEMHQVRYFLAAADVLNFTRAAEQCSVSQPALTTAIKKLEHELGAALFHREANRLLLSDFGRMMRPHLCQILDQTDKVQTVAQNFRLLHHVPVRLGVMSTIGPVRLSRFLGRFQQEHEGVEVAVHEGAMEDLKKQLQAGDIDLAVLNLFDGADQSWRAETLYNERYVVIFPPEHRFERLNAVRLADVSGEAYVDRLACEMRELVSSTCSSAGIELYARFRSEREDWVQAMVLAKIGFAFMPEYSVILPDLLIRPLIEPSIERTISLVSIPGRQYSPAVAAFVRAARRYRWPG